jgi:hypothetical protein
MKRAIVIILFVVVIGSLAAQAQGGWAGVSQCYINGRWVTVKGNCPATASHSRGRSRATAAGGRAPAPA